MYDGPFCILSIVDNRTFKRLSYQVLDHDPNHRDIEAFFRRFHAALEARGLSLKGITTDGSSLYPEPIATAFGEVPHQLCTVPTSSRKSRKAVLGARMLRWGLAAAAPTLARGRPGSKAAKRAARLKKRIERKVSELFEHRYLFVRHHLTACERKTLARITTASLAPAPLRGLMEVYRLFDRRCRTDTALAKLARLRARLHSSDSGKVLKKLFLPGLEKAAGVPGREVAGGDVERSGAGEPSVSEDAKVGPAPGADASSDRGPSWHWTYYESDTLKAEAETTKTLHEARAA